MGIIRIVGVLVCWFWIASSSAQIIFTERPVDWQLYPRARNASVAVAKVKGEVLQSSGITSLTAKLLRGNSEIGVDVVTLSFSSGTASFDLELEIPVTRELHRIELVTNLSPAPILVADYIVAGDVFVVNGQSNALAEGITEAVDVDSFTRGYNGSDDFYFDLYPRWTELRFGQGGKWASRMATKLSQQLDVPMAVFNFAEGGQTLDYFLPGNPSNNFRELFRDLDTAGVRDHVRSIFWSQGEANGFFTSTLTYTEGLSDLLQRYRDSLGTDEVLMMQTRAFSCGTINPFICEAQRRYAESRQDVTLFSTVNAVADADECHFPYEGGYEVIGNRFADIMLDRSYGYSIPDAFTPLPDSARITGATEVTAYLNVPGSSLASSGNPWVDFRLEGIDKRAVSGRVDGNRIVLQFDTLVGGATGLSYLANQNPGLNYVHNERGVGIALWFDLSLVSGDGAANATVDADLRITSTSPQPAQWDFFSVEVALENTGKSTLHDAVVEIPLSSSLQYDGAQPAIVLDGELLSNDASWYIPSLRPGATARLVLNYQVIETDPEPIVWAQLVRVNQGDDPDSEPGNGQLYEVKEDDEARLTVLDRDADCRLTAEVVSSTCDTSARWTVEYEVDDQTLSGLEVDIFPTDVVLENDIAAKRIVFSFDSIAQRDTIPVRIRMSRPAGPYTCRLRLPDVSAPNGCQTSTPDTTISTSTPSWEEQGFRAFPNPVAAGQEVQISWSSSPAIKPEVVDLLTLAGEVLQVYRTDQALLLPQIPAGVYLLRAGLAYQRIVVW